ncbi:MAG: MFS transporter [Phenylobacterium sp.]
MTSLAGEARPRPRLGWPTMLAFGFGSVSRALKARSMSVFLLLYYNQVIGLTPALVSALIFVSVVFDAVVDPIVGQVSDNFRSRLGRRHPFMYAALIPVPILFFALWNPPVGQSDGVIAAYFLIVLLSLKLFDTFFDLPASALLPELVQDYDKRSVWIAVRSAFNSLTPLALSILAYNVFLKENADGSGGVLARDGYFGFAVFGALVMFTAMLTATVATHRQIPWLSQARPSTPPLRQILRETTRTLGNPSFLAYLGLATAIAVSAGVKQSLDIYWNLYVFGLQQSQMAGVASVGVIGIGAGVLAAPSLIKRFGRKHLLQFSLVAAFVFMVLPLTLWLMGLAPPNGSQALYTLLVVDAIAGQFFFVIYGMCGSGLLADVVEDVEVKTGLRSEGVLFAAEGLMSKSVGGVGALTAGLLLTLVHFPREAARDSVPPETLERLALTFIPTLGVAMLLGMISVSFYRISRSKHEANLAVLQARREAAGPADARTASPASPRVSPEAFGQDRTDAEPA